MTIRPNRAAFALPSYLPKAIATSTRRTFPWLAVQVAAALILGAFLSLAFL